MFKVGDKVVCVETGGYIHLTVGEVYDVVGSWGKGGVTVLNDNGFECWMLSSRFKPYTQAEAEHRGAKFGVTGVVKSTGDRVVFVKERNGFWRVFDEIGVDYDLKPSEIRLDHEPEFVAWKDAPEHLRYEASRVYFDGKPVKWIAKPEGANIRVVFVSSDGWVRNGGTTLTVKL